MRPIFTRLLGNGAIERQAGHGESDKPLPDTELPPPITQLNLRDCYDTLGAATPPPPEIAWLKG